MDNLETTIFQIILHGGNGKSSAMEAIMAAKQGDFPAARQKLKEAAEALNEAHVIQNSLIQGEVRGEKTEVSLLLVHAQDHLMNAITIKDLAAEFVELYERIGE
ncbi:PTS lactose/cellobiose transporter subunit IIA [Metabacillus sp. GX 13764]|uniref:PTS lactose/cellobiose transporter subunit IIA n=1 Tax=Metabacillus kandeliae TaxID=2900151 RepID=UPI001E56BC8F|nr:PTS lactose/cellobiose transporter subunit IIA [Metabacillus kandeliae]MCD7034542.1 PTS lactose/cellobiose transporter subunit IIA [Metabacillus kandeliae]